MRESPALHALLDDLNTPRAMAALRHSLDPVVAEIITGPLPSPAHRKPDKRDIDAVSALFSRARDRQLAGDGEGAARIVEAMRDAGFVVNHRPHDPAGPALYFGCDWFGSMMNWPADNAGDR